MTRTDGVRLDGGRESLTPQPTAANNSRWRNDPMFPTKQESFMVYNQYDNSLRGAFTETQAFEEAAKIATKTREPVFVLRAHATVAPKYEVVVTPWQVALPAADVPEAERA